MYKDYLLNSVVRMSQDFPFAAINRESIYADLKTTNAKKDIDALTKKILEIEDYAVKKLQAAKNESSKNKVNLSKTSAKTKSKLKRKVKSNAKAIAKARKKIKKKNRTRTRAKATA